MKIVAHEFRSAAFIVICTILLCTAATGTFAGENDLSFKAGLPGWRNPGNIAVFDPSNTISGAGSLKLTGSGNVSMDIHLDPDTQYELSFSIKGKDIQSGPSQGARAVLNSGKHWRRFSSFPDNRPETGTFDWKHVRAVIDTSLFPDSKIRLELHLIGTGTVWFDELKIEKTQSVNPEEKYFRKQYSPAVKRAGVIPEGVSGFFDPGQEITFRVLTESSAEEMEFAAAVKNESGREVYRIPRGKLEETIRIPGQECGYYILDAEIFADGEKAYSVQSAFVVNVPVKRADPFFQMGFGASPELIPGFKRIGVGSVVLREPNVSVLGTLKKSAEELTDRFMKSQKPFLDDPDFVLTNYVSCSPDAGLRTKEELKAGWPLVSDPVLKLQLDYVKLVHERTRGRVREWVISCEIPSNANGGRNKRLAGTWTEAMFNMMIRVRTVSRALKETDPGITIIAGGNNIQEFTDTVERIVMRDLINDFDIYAIDGYTGNWDMRLGTQAIPELKLMDFYKAASGLSDSLGKGKIIRNDETGYAINYGARFDRGLAVEQACLTARTTIITRYAPVSRFELHMPGRADVSDSIRDDSQYMTTCWKPLRLGKACYQLPLPGGAMYATAASQLSYVQSLAEVKHGNIYSYLFRKPDGTVLITLWNTAEEQPFVCDFPDGTTAVNMYGRSISPKNLTIGPAPVYITLNMAPEDAVSLMKKAVQVNTPEFKCTADENHVHILSYATETKVGRLQLPGQAETEVKLLPGRVNTIEANVAGPGTLTAPDGRTYAVPLTKAGTITVPRIREKPVFDGSGKWLEGLPSGELKYPENVRPSEALQPERRYFRSNFNPDGHNLSAQYWTAYDDESFYLAVKVDDPVHQQRCTGSDIWQDDSLQFVLSHETGGGMLASPGRQPRSEYSYGLALTTRGVQLVKYHGKDHGLKEYPANVTRSGDMTFYEVAIPWKEIGGKASRFGLVVFNNDFPAEKAAPYCLVLTDGVAYGADDTKLKVIRYGE
ncbi:MAG: hypothetical protein J5944_15360 [Lentisphaeria bacterium]|nr:hypothetical protein [Lentisphaeria bacterium]